MKSPLVLCALVLAGVPLAGCVTDDYYGGSSYYGSRYYGSHSAPWYDNHYGSIYDGYWGDGGYYHYRLNNRDRWRRDDGRHFRADRDRPSMRHYRYDRANPPADWNRGGDGRRWRNRDGYRSRN